MNGLGKPFRKNPIQKIEKTVRTKKLKTKKPLATKRTFVQELFSASTYKLERKKFTQQNKPLAFSFRFLFQRNQNYYSNLT